MRPRFLNQKLGKRMTRKAQLAKAKAALAAVRPSRGGPRAAPRRPAAGPGKS